MKILVAFLKARARITSSTNHKGWESLSKESKILRRIVHIVAVIFSFKSTLIKQSSLPRSWLLGGSPQPTIDRALGVLTGLPRSLARAAVPDPLLFDPEGVARRRRGGRAHPTPPFAHQAKENTTGRGQNIRGGVPIAEVLGYISSS